MKCLLVEDSSELAQLVRLALCEFSSWELDLAPTLAAGEAYLETGSYDLVLLDGHLPDGSGFTRREDWLARFEVPIALFSASDPERMAQFAAQGMLVVAKPFDPCLLGDQLLALVATLAPRPAVTS